MNSYWVLIAMFGLMGIGNTVYHPADYALLSRHVSPERVSQAYSIHTFAGLAGGAAAPGTLLLMHSQFGWRGAFMGAAILGFVVAVVLLFQRDEAPAQPGCQAARRRAAAPTRAGGCCCRAPILINFVFFMLLSLTNFGLHELLGGRARRAARHLAGHRQHRAAEQSGARRDRRAGRRLDRRAHRAGTPWSPPRACWSPRWPAC